MAPQQQNKPIALQDLPIWQTLLNHHETLRGLALGELLDQPDRYSKFSFHTNGFVLDCSRNPIDARGLDLLFGLARECGLEAAREQLFAGRRVNNTERRPALHMALRADGSARYEVDGKNVVPEVLAEREKMLALAEDVRTGRFLGYSGEPIEDVVNIGIGGSDLGSVMVTEALKPFAEGAPRIHFVSNIDGCQLADVVAAVDPERTLFVICSKSFTTLETRLNAEAARRWLLQALPEAALRRHFVAVSVNDPAMDEFGIDPSLRLKVWDWVGGRYSLWSSVGFVIAVAIGAAAFGQMLAGAADLDRHFRAAPLDQNLPVILGLIGIWNQNVTGVTSHAVLPYDARLHRFPAFLQQLEMESNGKHVRKDGQPVRYTTGTVVWGEPGSNAQHSFFQLLHQGTSRVTMDFIAPIEGSSPYQEQHLHGLANMLAQAEALARGVSRRSVIQQLVSSGIAESEAMRLAPHKEHEGGRASNILLFDRLDPRNLGFLIALYEHKVFVQSVIWGINPFDQWGVELGKTMAVQMHRDLSGAGDVGRLPGIAQVIRKRIVTEV